MLVPWDTDSEMEVYVHCVVIIGSIPVRSEGKQNGAKEEVKLQCNLYQRPQGIPWGALELLRLVPVEARELDSCTRSIDQ